MRQSLLPGQFDEARSDGGAGEFQDAERDGKRESPGACAAGIEVEHAPAMLDGRLVRVPADDGRDAGRGWVEVEGGEIMQHVEVVSGKLDELGGRKLGAWAEAVDVSAYGGDGGDGAEGVDNRRVADVTGVEDVIDAAESGEGFGAEQAVSV